MKLRSSRELALAAVAIAKSDRVDMSLPPAVGRPYTPPTDQINWWEEDHHGNNKWENTTVKTINLIHQENPSYVKTKDRRFSRLPLHRAIVGNAAKEVIFTIYDLYPHAVKHQERNGYLPIHWAAERNRIDIIPFLFSKFAKSIIYEDELTNTPLDLAMRFNRFEAYTIIEKYLNSMILKDNTLALIAAKKKKELDQVLEQSKLKWKDKQSFRLNEQYEARNEAVGQQGEPNVRAKNPAKNGKESSLPICQEERIQDLEENERKLEQERLEVSDKARKIIQRYQIDNLFCNTLTEAFFKCSRWIHTTSNTILRLHNDDPQKVHQPDTLGLLPLNYAVQNNASVDVIKTLYGLNTHAIDHKDNNGEVALHDAARQNVSADIINFLANKYPEGMTIQNKEGKTPLDLAKLGSLDDQNKCKEAADLLMKIEFDMKMQNGEDWMMYARKNIGQIRTLYSRSVTKWEYTSVKHLLGLHHRNPHHVKTPNGTDTKQWLPLFYAINGDAPKDVVKHLYELHPKAIEHKDSYKYLPLHLAAEKNRGMHIPFLVQKYPYALRIRDTESKTPLERAIFCESHIAERILTNLEKKYKERLDEEEALGNVTDTALRKRYWHRAREIDNLFSTSDKWERTTVETVTYLTKCHPKDCETLGVGGVLPFHIAIRNNARVNVLKLLYELYPPCVKHSDNFGWLPIHYAADSNRVDIVSWLADLNPISLKACDKKGRTAWDIAKTQKHDEVADTLEQCAHEHGIDLQR